MTRLLADERALRTAVTWAKRLAKLLPRKATESLDGIIARRQRGDHQPDDAGTLALIAADTEGLTGLLADAEGVVAAARVPVDAAARAVSAARQFLAKCESDAAADMLVEHARKLDALLLETARQIDEMPGGKGVPLWGPTRELHDALRRLRSRRGEL